MSPAKGLHFSALVLAIYCCDALITWILCKTAGAPLGCRVLSTCMVVILCCIGSWLREAIDYAHTFGPLNIFWYFGYSAFC